MKKLTISVEDDVYAGLYAQIGKGNISRFLNDVARSHVLTNEIQAGYEAMAADQEREAEALEWSEISIKDQHHD